MTMHERDLQAVGLCDKFGTKEARVV